MSISSDPFFQAENGRLIQQAQFAYKAQQPALRIGSPSMRVRRLQFASPLGMPGRRQIAWDVVPPVSLTSRSRAKAACSPIRLGLTIATLCTTILMRRQDEVHH